MIRADELVGTGTGFGSCGLLVFGDELTEPIMSDDRCAGFGWWAGAGAQRCPVPQ